MHIVLYSPSWPAEVAANGIVTYCSHVKPALEGAGHRVSIVSGGNDHASAKDCYYINQHETLARGALRKIYTKMSQEDRYFENLLLRLLEKVNREIPIDIFEIEESFGWHRTIALKASFPVVMRLHGPHFCNSLIERDMSERSTRRIAREKQAFENARYMSSPSRYVYDLVGNTYDTNLKVSQVIANPVSISTPKLRWSQRRSKPRQLLFVGRFDLIKGGDIVIQMFAKYLHKFPDGRLVFVGPDAGIKDKIGHNVKLEEYVKRNLAANQVNRVLIYGTQSPEVILKLRAESAATVVASRTEVFSYSAIEAIAMGCPLVAPAIGGIPENIVHGQNGMLFESENVDDFLDKVSDLIENPEKAKYVADNGYQTCLDKLGAQKLGTETESFYKKCISHQ